MGLLSKLKSMLGMEDRDRSRGSGVDVTVERDPGAESESADDGDEPAAEGTDAAASTGSLVDEESADDPKKAAEPAEAAQPATDAPDSDEDAPGAGDEVDADSGDESTEPDDAESTSDSPDEADVDPDVELGDIKGIGPAYEERLRDAGVDSVADLAAADADELAEETDLSPKRVGRWIEHAQDQ